MSRTLLLFSLFLSLSLATKIILAPPTTSSNAVALLMIQGASISPDRYVSLFSKLQSSSSSSIWVGISDFTLDMPDPLTMGSMVADLLAEMKAKGLPDSHRTFYAGHSLGGTVLALHLKDVLADGVILMGSFLNRSVRSLNADGSSRIAFLSPTLTVGNELDGQCRVSRIAEQFFHSVDNIQVDQRGKHPVVVVKGASHMQFASGEPPIFVKQNDMRPEITEDEAHSRISEALVAFIDGDQQTLNRLVTEASEFLRPLITALKLEGSYHFRPACDDTPLENRNQPDCGHGSDWVNYAQSILAGLDQYHIKSVNLIVDDNFHKVWEILPVHLPECNTTCQNGSAASCDLHCTTVTEVNYEVTDDLDTGFYPVTAHELKSKMSSRQRVLEHVGVKVDFHTTDEIPICQTINQAAYQWALDNAGKATLARFQTDGEHYVMGDDEGPYNAGPLWIWYYLSFDEKQDSTGEYYINIQSPMMRTPTDYLVSAAAGFHYCKLLSPARAMEWLYVDGLKRKRSLTS